MAGHAPDHPPFEAFPAESTHKNDGGRPSQSLEGTAQPTAVVVVYALSST
ncbi:hypothetical protein [Arthrobacter sp. Soil782]|nr:hypothetical protein [Arthrobacter sp. Soil782]